MAEQGEEIHIRKLSKEEAERVKFVRGRNLSRWGAVLTQLLELDIGEGLQVDMPGADRAEARKIQNSVLAFAREHGRTWKVQTATVTNSEGVVAYFRKIARDEDESSTG